MYLFEERFSPFPLFIIIRSSVAIIRDFSTKINEQKVEFHGPKNRSSLEQNGSADGKRRKKKERSIVEEVKAIDF